MSKCRHCGAEIVWATTEYGRKMPLDPKPSPLGNVIAVEAADGSAVARVLGSAALALEPPAERWVSHFKTCGAKP